MHSTLDQAVHASPLDNKYVQSKGATSKYAAGSPAIHHCYQIERSSLQLMLLKLQSHLKCWLCNDTCMVNQMMCDASLRAKVQQTLPCSQAASLNKEVEEQAEILQVRVSGW